MKPAKRRKAESIFQQAADIEAEFRPAFLLRHCGDDPEIRSEVESLLDCLDSNEVSSLRTIDTPDESDLVGKQIGPYQLLELLGEGGFGSVFMAAQEKPIRRKVALKIIKLGMDTKQVIARFEAERQALALMDHPNIAKVFDAGATATGRPYFVMELVNGIPITEYCDQSRLSITARLDLFTKVCSAVQHAHQKGIIHRDIKPTNVLVTLNDGQAVPKVIDFGVAKAMSQRLTDKTLFTEFRQLVGTPEYMSPEQAELSGLDVDTRTDIYSLGVLLYMLLTGNTPFAPRKLREEAFGEIQRIIREVDPPTPSQRVSRCGTDLETVAASRQASPQQLSRFIRGDLDWIVMKTLEKDRQRRYETAGELAVDIQRHLANQPVKAGPPGLIYKVGKFVRRHRFGVTAGALTLVALLAGLSIAAYFFVQTVKAKEDLAREAQRTRQVNEILESMIASVDPRHTQGKPATMRFVLDETTKRLDRGDFNNQLEATATIRMTLGKTYEGLGLYEQAGANYKKAVVNCTNLWGENSVETLRAKNRFAAIVRSQRNYKMAENLFCQQRALGVKHFGEEHPETLEAMNGLGVTLTRQGHYHQAEAIHRRTMMIQEHVLGAEDTATIRSMVNLSTALLYQKKLRPAARLLCRSYYLDCKHRGTDHPGTLSTMNNLGLVLARMGNLRESLWIFRRTVDTKLRVLGKAHPETARSMLNLINLLEKTGNKKEVHHYTKIQLDCRKEIIKLNPTSADHLNSLAWELMTNPFPDLRDSRLALVLAKKAMTISQGRQHEILDTLALAHAQVGEYQKAINYQRKAISSISAPMPMVSKQYEDRLLEFLWDSGDRKGWLKHLLENWKTSGAAWENKKQKQ